MWVCEFVCCVCVCAVASCECLHLHGATVVLHTGRRGFQSEEAIAAHKEVARIIKHLELNEVTVEHSSQDLGPPGERAVDPIRDRNMRSQKLTNNGTSTAHHTPVTH